MHKFEAMVELEVRKELLPSQGAAGFFYIAPNPFWSTNKDWLLGQDGNIPNDFLQLQRQGRRLALVDGEPKAQRGDGTSSRSYRENQK